MSEERDHTLAVALTLACGAALVCGGVLVFGVPGLLGSTSRKPLRAEVPSNVDAIKTAQLGYEAAFDEFLPMPRWPRPPKATDRKPMRWTEHPDWAQLGWAPDGDVRGSYWVEVNDDRTDFTVYGVADVDGDGVKAWYTATKSINVMFLNANDTY